MMASLAIIPGASVALVITRTITLGVANGIAVAVGIVLGDLLFILLAILGLTFIAETMGSLFLIIKIFGGLYLLWLGYTLLTSTTDSTISVLNTGGKASLLTSFLAGLVLTLGDIKAIIFYVSLFPLLINLNTLTTFDAVIIAIITIATVGGIKIAYAFSARTIINMSSNHKMISFAKRVAGGFMLGAGTFLIIKP